LPVEKKRLLTAVFISALIMSTIAGTQLVNIGNANPIPSPIVKIKIENPQNTTYNVSSIHLVFSVNKINIDPWLSLSYSLDGQGLSPLGNVTSVKEEIIPVNPKGYIKTLRGNWALSNLSEGWHSIVVYAHSLPQNMEAAHSAEVNFLIDTAPSISISSLESKTYNTSSIALNFTVSEPVSQVKYSLDGQENVTISGNTTLTELPNGKHNVTVYATDDTGNTAASENIIFNVDKPEPPEPFPTALLATTSGASIAIIGIGSLVYLKKRKK